MFLKRRIIAGLVLGIIILASLSAQTALIDANDRIPTRTNYSPTVDEYKWYSFSSEELSQITVELVSLDFTPFLVVQSPSGQQQEFYADGSSVQGSFFTQEAGEWQLGVGYLSARRNGDGSYMLRVTSGSVNPALVQGQTRRGDISTNDFFDSEDGRHIDWYPLALEAGERVRILLESQDFDAYLYIRSMDGSLSRYDDGMGSNSVASVSASERGTIMVGASAFYQDSTGSYFLTVEEPPAAQNISLDRTINGRLTGSMPVNYLFTAPRDGAYKIDLSSTEFDTKLWVTGPSGQVLENDDAMGGYSTDSRISLGLRAGEQAFIEAGAYGSGTGNFSIRVSAGQTLSIGSEIRGTYPEDSEFSLTGSEGQYVEIEVLSNDFDTYLSITTPDGYTNGNDDSSPGDDYYWASRMSHFFEEDGSITIIVGSYSSSESGGYLLRAGLKELAGPISEYPEGHELVQGQTLLSTISGNEPALSVGPGDVYSIEAEAGEQIKVSMISDSFDTYLTLVAPNGQEFSDDDSLGNLDAYLEVSAPVSGRYQLIASSYSSSGGIYELLYESGGVVESLFSSTGQISDDDQRDIRGNRYDSIGVNLRSGQGVSIRVSSTDFDTLLYVNDPQGNLVAENDDYNGSDSRIDLVAEMSGEYQLIIMPYSSGSRGSYSLQVLEW